MWSVENLPEALFKLSLNYYDERLQNAWMVSHLSSQPCAHISCRFNENFQLAHQWLSV